MRFCVCEDQQDQADERERNAAHFSQLLQPLRVPFVNADVHLRGFLLLVSRARCRESVGPRISALSIVCICCVCIVCIVCGGRRRCLTVGRLLGLDELEYGLRDEVHVELCLAVGRLGQIVYQIEVAIGEVVKVQLGRSHVVLVLAAAAAAAILGAHLVQLEKLGAHVRAQLLYERLVLAYLVQVETVERVQVDGDALVRRHLQEVHLVELHP